MSSQDASAKLLAVFDMLKQTHSQVVVMECDLKATREELEKQKKIAPPKDAVAARLEQTKAGDPIVKNLQETIQSLFCAKFYLSANQLTEVIHKGKQSTIYRVEVDGTVFAVKELKGCRDFLDFSEDFTLRADLFRPVQHRHPYLLELYGFGISTSRLNDSLYVMMACKDFSLDKYLVSAEREKAFLSIETCVLMGRQMLAAVQYLHSNFVVHGRIMPENVLLECLSPTKYKITLSNFGISPKLGTVTMSRTSGGTEVKELFPYWCPEMLTGEIKEDEPLYLMRDIFAFGVTFWELYATMLRKKTSRYEVSAANFLQAVRNIPNQRPKLDGFPEDAVEYFRHTWDSNPELRFSASEAFEEILNLIPLPEEDLADSEIPSLSTSVAPPMPPSAPPPPDLKPSGSSKSHAEAAKDSKKKETSVLRSSGGGGVKDRLLSAIRKGHVLKKTLFADPQLKKARMSMANPVAEALIKCDSFSRRIAVLNHHQEDNDEWE